MSVAIVGANGIVGRWLADLAVESGHIVTGIDLNEHSSPDLSHSEYLRADVTAPTSEAIVALGKADWVLICLPEETALSSTPSLLSMMKQDALWVDTLSVKMRQASRLRSCLGTREALSINPMFAPIGHLQGGNVAVVTIRPGPSADLFTKMLRSSGFDIQQTTAEAHDRKVAVVQIATHAAILSFAEVLYHLGGDINDLVPFGTPPFLAMASLAARMASLSPQVYWDVQAGNRHGQAARAALLAAMTEIDRAVNTGDYQAFVQIFARIGAFVDPQQDGLRALSQTIAACTSDWNAGELTSPTDKNERRGSRATAREPASP